MAVERRDYVALEWVAGEIAETLQQSVAELNAYLDNRADITRLRFCLTYIHQVYGTLKMVEFAGAALLAEEMEAAAQALVAGAVPEAQREDALLALKTALDSLPSYLRRLLVQHRDAPALLLPLINDLRAVRGEVLITESAIFSPDLTPAVDAVPVPLGIDAAELADIARKLRQMYQMALLNYLRNNDPRQNLNYLAKVCARLAKLAAGRPAESLWKICIALCEGLLNRSIQPAAAVKLLLRQVDTQLKALVEQGEAALQLQPPTSLVKNLLYYIAASGANSRYIADIKQAYKLPNALPPETETASDTPDDEATLAVKAALAHQLANLAHQLPGLPVGKGLVAAIKRVQDTAALLGMARAQGILQELLQGAQADRLNVEAAVRNLHQLAEGLEWEQRPSAPRPLFNDSEEAQEQLDKAFDAIMRESRNSLEQAKEAIIEFVATQWRHQCLEEVPELLAGVRGSFAVAGLHRAASVLAACENYVRKDLLGEHRIPAWQLLDTLADAIASVDYYLERLSEDAAAECESILDIAEQSVAALSTPQPAAEPASAQVIPFQRREADGERFDDEHGGAAEDASAEATAHEPPLLEPVDPEPVFAPHEVAEQQPAPLDDEPVVAADVGAEAESGPESEEDAPDPEIVEIFIEEAGEVLETIAAHFPQWSAQPDDPEALSTIRRAFHTLKGSGRMVGALAIGELAWSIENMLNRTIDGSLVIDAARVDAAGAAAELLSDMVEAFQHGRPHAVVPAAALKARAEALAKEQVPGSSNISSELGSSELDDSPEFDAAAPASFATDVEDLPAAPAFEEASEPPALEAWSGATALDDAAPAWGEPTAEPAFDEPAFAPLELEDQVPDALQSQSLVDTDPTSLEWAPRIADELPVAFDAELALTAEEAAEPSPESAADAIGSIGSTIALEPQGTEPGDEADILLDIFIAEAGTHLEVVEDFMRGAAGLTEPLELSDDLQRALHTLKGSAHMAEVAGIAQVVTPVERLVKELRAAQLKADPDVVDVLGQSVRMIRAGLGDSAATARASLPGADDFALAVDALRLSRLALLDGDSEQPGDGVSPAAVTRFLGDAIELISAVGDDLRSWRDQRLDDQRQHTLAATISQVSDSAEALNLAPIVELAQGLQTLLRIGADSPQPHDSFFSLAGLATDRLIDMLDRLAANQHPDIDAELLTALQDYDFGASAELVGTTIPVLDDVVELAAPTAASRWDAELAATETADTDTDTSEPAPIAALLDDYFIEQQADTAAPLDADWRTHASDHSLIAEHLEEPWSNEPADAVAPFDDSTSVSGGAALQAAAEWLPEDRPAADLQEEEAAAEALPLSAAPEEVDMALPAETGFEQQADQSTAYSEPQADADAALTEDEEIDAEILEIFIEEAGDLLEAIDESIHHWGSDRGNAMYLDDLQRLLHTLKGGARLAGLKNLGNLSHNFETRLINSQQQDQAVDDALLAEVQAYQDQLIRLVDAVKQHGHGGDNVFAAVLAEPDGAGVPPPVQATDTFETDTFEAQVAAPALETEDDSAAVADDAALNEVVAEDADHERADATAPVDIEPELLPATRPVEDDAAAKILAFSRPKPITPFNAPGPRDSQELLVTGATGEPGDARALRETESLPEIGGVAQQLRRGPQEVVKISAQLLEQLVNLAGETSIARGRAEEQVNEFVFSLDEMQITVDRLQEQVRRLDLETEAQMLFRQEQVESEGLEGFDPLEFDRYSLLQQLSRSLLESASDLIDIKNTLAEKSRDMETLLVQQSRINTELQEGLMRSRMVPFARMVPRLRRIVRQVAGELDKQVDFYVDNAEGELDRTVLERIVAPLEHMLRNALDHGVETAAERVALNKPAQGTIVLSVTREGGDVVLTLTDDGRGIDLNAVRAKALARGLMEAGANLSDHEVMQFILQAGFSTAKQITQISGRGVGMDVVYSEIKQLGGNLEIDSAWGKGTRFTVRLPFTVSVNRALMVSGCGDVYAIPLNTIEGIVRVSPFELEAYYQPDAPLFEYAGQPYLMRYIGALLHTADKPNLDGHTAPLPVLLVRGSDHAVAIQVDSLMGSREIVVKTLGPQFSQVQGLSGATVLGDGSVVVILDLLAMIRADALHLHRDPLLGHEEIHADRDRPLLVMVVDDSVTVRKVTSRFLERQGMEVILAKDGVDAISLLQDSDRIPDVMLLDIEMPRMDGFEVASRIRHTSRLRHLPIIMITSRTGEKHRDRATALGVDKYLGKPYQESLLLEAIHQLTGTIVST
jgi:chemosensory pili system protein ChpA (sensor histidine kinase/response regulator)